MWQFIKIIKTLRNGLSVVSLSFDSSALGWRFAHERTLQPSATSAPALSCPATSSYIPQTQILLFKTIAVLGYQLS